MSSCTTNFIHLRLANAPKRMSTRPNVPTKIANLVSPSSKLSHPAKSAKPPRAQNEKRAILIAMAFLSRSPNRNSDSAGQWQRHKAAAKNSSGSVMLWSRLRRLEAPAQQPLLEATARARTLVWPNLLRGTIAVENHQLGSDASRNGPAIIDPSCCITASATGIGQP